ncbi:MAG TPA: SDR family oxidoreductase [Acidimicrobiia bacterium]|nr:SDR family oxidoreductase [Acidimicrobiia bacterium]
MSQRRAAARPLAGRVAVVTGAGRGIGRAHALALADLGAAVLVNDLGTDLSGCGRDAEPADAVVAEIRARGGTALADGGDVASIAGGRAVVEHAVAELGRVDVVVNNAGFALGGGTVEEPEEAGLDALLAVHLRAAVGTMSAAFPVMRANGYGRVVNTVSEVALDARFAGPLGYGIAKAALWSATLSAAEEGRPYGITVNAISPGARTRMNADALDAGFREGASARLDLAPEHVAAVVAYLATPDAGDITGRVFHVAAGEIREYETRRHAGTELAERLAAAIRASR